MAQLENQGYAVVREADAATNGALQAQFGEKAAVPAVTHADGRPDPVVVYKACVPADAIEGIPVTEKSGDVRMYRAGNVILLIEPCATSD